MEKESKELKMFWIIEKKDIDELKKICEELKENKENIGMYANNKLWWQVFTTEETKEIKVYMCGVLDFSPVQHAKDIGWEEGVKCLVENNIGCATQGSGLSLVI